MQWGKKYAPLNEMNQSGLFNIVSHIATQCIPLDCFPFYFEQDNSDQFLKKLILASESCMENISV